MRWHYENVAFEPGGKDHSAAGSSRDTGVDIIEQIYGDDPPVYQMYDFITPKGSDKKISSSAGENTLTLTDLEDIYPPEMVRFLFSETKPNKEFAIPFDEDVFQRYDKFDRIEKTYFNPDNIDNDRKRKHWKRVYELAVVEVPEEKPVRVPFQHAAFVAQTVPEEEWRDKGIDSLQRTGHVPEDLSEKNVEQVVERLEKAKNWARNHAPEEYRYEINSEVSDSVVEKLSEEQLEAVKLLEDKLRNTGFQDQEQLDNELYNVRDESSLDTGEFFETFYRVLLSREQGPRLSRLIMSIGVEDTAEILTDIDE